MFKIYVYEYYMISKYNNQIILTIPDSKPASDEHAKKKGNSLREIDKKEEIKRWYECRDMCLENENCHHYDYKHANEICILYRNEPYKIVKDLSLDDCTEFCSRDSECDYLSHSANNTCSMHRRENYEGNSVIGDLWFDYPIYGYNNTFKKGIPSQSFEDCKKQFDGTNIVYYDKHKYCVPKQFTTDSRGSTTIFFNKTPVDKYEFINDIIGLKSENRKIIDTYKYHVVVIFFIIVIVVLIRMLS